MLDLIPLATPVISARTVLKPYGWVIVFALYVTAILTPLMRTLANRWGVVDRPDDQLKTHRRPIAYLGGVAIYLGWIAGMIPVYITHAEGRDWLLGLMLSGGVIMLVGLIDDLKNIAPKAKLLGQVAAAGILVGFGVGQRIWDCLLIPLQISLPDWLVMALSIPTSIFVVLAASNATNLLDGLDGLCSGVTGVISLCFLVLATHLAMYSFSGQYDPVRIAAALAMFGAVSGFLPYNYNPATIFMGDAGSMVLGLFAAAMMLMFGEQNVRWVLGSVMIFGLPILDTSLALMRRLRLGRPIFAGDRSHLYDQLVDRGFSVKKTVVISYGLAAFYGLVGLAIIVIRTRYAIFVYAGTAVVTLYLCHRLGFLAPPEPTKREREQME